MELEIAFPLLFTLVVLLVMNQMDKEDVLQKFQHQMFHLLQAQHHNAHSAKSQTDKEDACQNLLQVQFHAQLDI
ncbi:MAG: hypothetical protein EBZ77_13450 [Chitinophagia bacterium]|nr:hypothetical protein [Chitinophagia bacterium]